MDNSLSSSTVEWSIRDCEPTDYLDVLQLNNASGPMVNAISSEELHRLAAMSTYFRLAVHEQDGVVGVLLVLAHKKSYKSLNYQWFSERYEDFCYIDRVMVKKECIGQGIGRRLYDDLLTHRSVDAARYLCCEVNIKPMNAFSLSFHQRLGFVEVGQRNSTDDKRVSLLLKTLSP